MKKNNTNFEKYYSIVADSIQLFTDRKIQDKELFCIKNYLKTQFNIVEEENDTYMTPYEFINFYLNDLKKGNFNDFLLLYNKDNTIKTKDDLINCLYECWLSEEDLVDKYEETDLTLEEIIEELKNLDNFYFINTLK